MKLRKLAWTNYKQYKEPGEIDLSDLNGTVGILGNNGAGKSSLLRIIVISLFGIQASNENKSYLRTHGVENEPVYLKLEFSHEGEDYIIEREYRGVNLTPKASFWQYKEGYPQLLAQDVASVDSYVKKIIRLDCKAFLSTIFCQQKELDKLSEMTPANRKSFILKLAGVDKIDEEIKLTREKKRELTSFLTLLQKDIENKEKIENDLLALDGEVKELKKVLAKSNKELAKAEESYNIAKDEKSKHDEKEKEFNALSIRQSKIEAQVSSIIREIEKLEKEQTEISSLEDYMNKEGNAILEEYSLLQKEITDMEDLRLKFNTKTQLEKQLESVKNDGASTKTKLLKAKETLAALNFNNSIEATIITETKDINTKISELMEEKLELTAQYKSLNAKIEDNNKEVANIVNLVKESSNGCECPTCKQTVSMEHVGIIKKHYLSLNEGLVKERDEVLVKGKSIAATITTLQGNLENLKIKEKEFNNLKQSYNEAQVTIKHLTEDLNVKVAEYNRINTELEKYTDVSFDVNIYTSKVNRNNSLKDTVRQLYINNDKIKRLPSIVDSLNNSKDVKVTLDTQLADILNSIKILDFNIEEYRKINLAFDKAQEKLKTTEREVTNATHQVQLKDVAERKNLNNQLNEIKRKEKEYNDYSEKFRDYVTTEEVLKSTKVSIMKRISPIINRHLSNIFGTLIDGKYEDIKLDDNYDIFIQEGADYFPLAKYSGGEKDISNLALRLAISKFLTETNDGKIEFVVLDEIFASLDDERKASLIEVLNSLDKFFSQIFIISHEDTIKSSLENYISVKENEYGYSEVTIENYA